MGGGGEGQENRTQQWEHQLDISVTPLDCIFLNLHYKTVVTLNFPIQEFLVRHEVTLLHFNFTQFVTYDSKIAHCSATDCIYCNVK